MLQLIHNIKTFIHEVTDFRLFFSEALKSAKSFWVHFIMSSNKAGILVVAYAFKKDEKY